MHFVYCRMMLQSNRVVHAVEGAGCTGTASAGCWCWAVPFENTMH